MTVLELIERLKTIDENKRIAILDTDEIDGTPFYTTDIDKVVEINQTIRKSNGTIINEDIVMFE